MDPTTISDAPHPPSDAPNVRASAMDSDRDRIEALRRLARAAIDVATESGQRLWDPSDRSEVIAVLSIANAAMDAIERLQRVR